jgi:chromosome segregation protein
LRWTQAKAQEGEAQSALSPATALVGERAQRADGGGQGRRPSARIACRNCATPPKPPRRVLQRLNIAKAQIDEEAAAHEPPAIELERRSSQLASPTSRAKSKMFRDNADIVERLAKEETAPARRGGRIGRAREFRRKARLRAATATLTLSEPRFPH